MKHFAKLLISIVLMGLAPLSSQAQGVTDAFYIYQNDGHFDGFFYDEVIEIRYSKLDTLNLEHSDFVSQEIVTADSTYRIMLAAIDSVGFVQPEVKVNEHIRYLQKEGYYNSIYSIDGQTITFRTMSPYDIKPGDISVGDILVNSAPLGVESADVVYQDFCGRVTSISSNNFTMTVQTEAITDAKEIYPQFRLVEEYKATEKGQILSRRVAGMPMLGRGQYAPPSLVLQERRAGEADYDLLDFTFNTEVPLNKGKPDIKLLPNIEGKVTIKAVWDMPDYMGITTKVKYGVGMGLEIDGSLGEGFEKTSSNVTRYVAIPLPAAAPLFELEVIPNLFIRGEGHIKFAMQSPKWRGQLWQKIEVINYELSGSSGSGPVPGEDPTADAEPNSSTASVSLEGSLMTGFRFPLNLKTNTLLSYLFKCNVGAFAYIGPKLSANVSLDLTNVLNGDNKVYNNFKDSKISFNPLTIDVEAKGTYENSWFGGKKEVTFYSTSLTPMPTYDMFFFPQFTDWQEKDLHIGDKDTVKTHCLTVKPSVRTVTPIRVGIASYKLDLDESEEPDPYNNINWAATSYWQFKSPWLSKENDPLYYPLLNLRPGPHRFYPVFYFMGKLIKATPSYNYTVPGTYLMIDADTLKYGLNGGTRTFRMQTNSPDIRIKCSPNADCAKTLQWEYTDKQGRLTMPRKDGILTGSPAMWLEAYDAEGKKWDTKTLRVVRTPSGHIGRFYIRLGCRGESQLIGDSYQSQGNFSDEIDADINLGFGPSETLSFRKETKENKETTIIDELHLTLDLSHPDSISEFGYISYQHITGGTYHHEERREWEVTYWDNESESEKADKYVRIETYDVTITKFLYALADDGDSNYGEFSSIRTELVPEGNQWSEEPGVTVKAEYTQTKNGKVEQHGEWNRDPEFEFKILKSK